MQPTKIVLSLLAVLAVAALAVTFPASQSHAQTINTLGSFNGGNGEYPQGSLTLSADGSTFYGTASYGGANKYYGDVFSIPVTGGTPTVLGSFDEATSSGSLPAGSLTLSTDGTTLYGTTKGGGGPAGVGAVFSISVNDDGGTAPTLLGSFTQNNQFPLGSLTLSGSTLYGTTQSGGTGGIGGSSSTSGEVFSIPAAGGTPTVLGSFNSSYSSGANPQGSLTLSGSTLYGTTYSGGGANNEGAIFSIPVGGLPVSTPPTVLGSFSGTANGANPEGSLTLVGSTLYGTTYNGGAHNDGAIFSIPLNATPGTAPTLLGSFNGTGDGANPQGSLTLVGSTLYGTTYGGGANGLGAIFSIPLTGGVPTLVASFDGTNGQGPVGDLTLVGSTLYGTTEYGGAGGAGSVFSLTVVPEPSSIVLMILGAIAVGAAVVRLRMRRRAASWTA